MKILVVSSFLPYPLFSGGHIRLFNIIKLLSKNHEITLVCEKRAHQTEDDIAFVKKYCNKVITVDRKKQWGINVIAKTGFSFYPFLLVGHTQDPMQQAIVRLLQKESFDLIHVETFYVMQNLPKVSLPTVLVEHNIEYLVYKRLLTQLPLFLRPLFFIDIRKLEYWEKFFWKKATKLVAVSDEEKAIMKRKDVEIVPNGVDTEKFSSKGRSAFGQKIQKKEIKILFIGDFKWIQNKDAVGWILKEIWPQLSSKLDLRLWIVGRKIPSEIRKLTNDENVIFDENAPTETEKIFEQVDILLAPIRVGGGTSYKILEAMASGVPVITTKLGIEGIDAKNNKEVLIADRTEEMVDAIISLIENHEQYHNIAQNARKLIEKKYDWKEIVKKLEEVYISAVNSNY